MFRYRACARRFNCILYALEISFMNKQIAENTARIKPSETNPETLNTRVNPFNPTVNDRLNPIDPTTFSSLDILAREIVMRE